MRNGQKTNNCHANKISRRKMNGRSVVGVAVLVLVLCATLALSGCSMASGSDRADAMLLIAQSQESEPAGAASVETTVQEGTGAVLETSQTPAESEHTTEQMAPPESTPELIRDLLATPEPIAEPAPVPVQPAELPLLPDTPTDMPAVDMENPEEVSEESTDDGLVLFDFPENNVPGSGNIPVPSVIGMMWDDAKRELESSGFIVEPIEVYCDTAAIGIVVGQHPFPFFQKSGSLVELDVCIGKNPVTDND